MCITHGHSDHSFALPKILSPIVCNKKQKKKKKVVILVPEKRGSRDTAKLIRTYINSFFQLNMCSNKIGVDSFIDIYYEKRQIRANFKRYWLK